MRKKNPEAEGWTPEQLKELADAPGASPPEAMTGMVAELDAALAEFRSHYAKASPKFRKEAVEYLYRGIGQFETRSCGEAGGGPPG